MRQYPGIHALVVDDEPSARVLLREAFEALAVCVTEAVDGADAIHKFLLEPYDLVTMDILMPNVNGLDAIRALRTVDPSCRVIIVSSCKAQAYQEAARELGAPPFIFKPVRLADFYRATELLLGDAPAPGDSTQDGRGN